MDEETGMAEIWTMGELLCEIMRTQKNAELYEPGVFRGPYPSGAPAICIDTVARLGHSAGIIGGVGQDDFGKCIVDRLQKDGVDISHVIRSDEGSTAVAFVTYYSDGSRKFIFHIGNTPATKARAPESAEVFADAKYFHVMGCSLMASIPFGREIVKTMDLFRKAGAKISFDPNIRPELMKDPACMLLIRNVMQHCSIFEPGVVELLMISGKNTVDEAVAACFENPALELLALKNGSRGCTLFSRSETVKLGIYPADVVDPTGAGDCFDGALLCALIEGKSLREAGEYATAAAGLNTAMFGPMEGKISRETIAQAMRQPMEMKE